MKIMKLMRILSALNFLLMNLKMEQYILDSGKMGLDTEEENNYGTMEVYMKVIGKIILQMEKED